MWPLIERGVIGTEVQHTFALDEAVQAHTVLEQNEQVGKLVLVVDLALVQDYARRM